MIEIAASPSTTTLVIDGDLDIVERDQFPEVTARVTGLRRPLLVVDMCRVTFMDSTGAAFLISLADSSRRRGGATVLRNPDPRELFVLEVCGALDLFRIDATHRCAVGATSPEGASSAGSGSATPRGTGPDAVA